MALASILPLPRAVFYDANGNPLGAGLVYTYVPGTTTPKTSWQDSGEVTPNANPITLDAAGSCLLYGAGSYALNVTDSLGNAIPAYSGLTFDTATSAGISPVMVPVVGAATIAIAQANLGVPGVFNIMNTAYAGGADPTGVADSTPAIQAAVAAAQTAGGGIVWVPPGTFLVNGTITVSASGVSIVGANWGSSTLNFENGAADCVVFTGVNPTSVIQGNGIFNLNLTHSGKSGGNTVHVSYCNQFTFQNLISNGAWNLFEIFVTNTVYVRDVWVEQILNGSGYGIFWHAPGDGSARCDYLRIENFSMDAQYSGANGIVLDGLVATLICTGSNILRCNFGIVVDNSAASAGFVANFIHFTDLSMEGFLTCAVQINTGTFYKFLNCDISNNTGASGQGSLDTNVVQINQDSIALVRSVKFVNCWISGSRQSALICNAKNVTLDGCEFEPFPGTTAATFAAVFIGATADDVTIRGCSCWAFGAPASWLYGLFVSTGAFRVIEDTNNWAFATTPVAFETTDPWSVAGVDIQQPVLSLLGAPTGFPSGTTLTGTVTLTTAQTLNGAFVAGGSGGFTATTPTAAQLVAGFGSQNINKLIPWKFVNANSGTGTLQCGSGVTPFGNTASVSTFTIGATSTRDFTIWFVNTTLGSEAVTIIG